MMQFLEEIWAHVCCEWYLLWKGMWKGECKFVGWNNKNKVSYIASTTGSIWDGTINVKRVFFNKTTEGNKMSKEMKLLKQDLDSTNYIRINVEQGCQWRETKGISFNTKEECDVIRKHVISALIELGDKPTEGNKK